MGPQVAKARWGRRLSAGGGGWKGRVGAGRVTKKSGNNLYPGKRDPRSPKSPGNRTRPLHTIRGVPAEVLSSSSLHPHRNPTRWASIYMRLILVKVVLHPGQASSQLSWVDTPCPRHQPFDFNASNRGRFFISVRDGLNPFLFCAGLAPKKLAPVIHSCVNCSSRTLSVYLETPTPSSTGVAVSI